MDIARNGAAQPTVVIHDTNAVAAAPARVQPEAPSMRTVRDAGEMRDCPYCAESIKAAAVLCRHCRSDLPRIVEHGRAALAPLRAPALPGAVRG